MTDDELTPVWGAPGRIRSARFWICCASGSECDTRREPMKIKLASMYVDDQEKALRFSTDVLGFVKFEAFDH